MGKNVVRQAKSAVLSVSNTPAVKPAVVKSPSGGPSAERVAELLGGPVKGEPTPVKTPEVAKGEKTGKESGNTPANPPPAVLKSVPKGIASVVSPPPAKGEEKRPNGLHPFCVIPSTPVGTSVFILLRGHFRKGVVHAHSTGGRIVIGKIEGIRENVTHSVSNVFASMEQAEAFRAWVREVISTPLPVPPKGTKVAAFDVSGDLGYDSVMYRAEVVSDPEESGQGVTVSLYYDWQGTTDSGFPVENLRDAVCVTDSLANEYALAYVRALHPGDRVSE